MHQILKLAGAATVVAFPCVAIAYEYRVRFVERVGDAETVLAGNTIDASSGGSRRIRFQFGVFDDDDGAAPAGGYVGWNVGTLDVHGGIANSDESRSPGRLSPFTFAPASAGANGAPAGDPFESLTGIDNTLGQQGIIWRFGEPYPLPIIRGLNTFVSTYEITIDPRPGAHSFSIDLAGRLLAALEWRPQETEPPTPETPSFVTYAPFVDDPFPFAATLHVFVPGPAAGMLVSLGGLVAISRRRPALPIDDN